MCTVKKLFVVNFLFVNFEFKFFYAVPPLRLTPPCICTRAMPRAKEGRQKVPILKKIRQGFVPLGVIITLLCSVSAHQVEVM